MEAGSRDFSALIFSTGVRNIQEPPRTFHTPQDAYVKYPGTQVKFVASENQEAKVMFPEQEEAKQKPVFTETSNHSINFSAHYFRVV